MDAVKFNKMCNLDREGKRIPREYIRVLADEINEQADKLEEANATIQRQSDLIFDKGQRLAVATGLVACHEAEIQRLQAENERLSRGLKTMIKNLYESGNEKAKLEAQLADSEQVPWRKKCFDYEDYIDLMLDEFKRIRNLTENPEIHGLCDRALTNTKQIVPVIEQRDKAQARIADLERELAAERGKPRFEALPTPDDVLILRRHGAEEKPDEEGEYYVEVTLFPSNVTVTRLTHFSDYLGEWSIAHRDVLLGWYDSPEGGER